MTEVPHFSRLDVDLVEAIRSSINNHLPSNAAFLGERLLAENDSEETRNVLAECYMRENKW